MNLLIKTKAVLFCAKIKYDLSVDSLMEYFKKHKYKITRFNGSSDRTKTLFACLKIRNCFLETQAFTYKTKEEKIVFVNAGLTDRELLYALLREAAHHELGHAAISYIAGYNTKMLSEAAEFAEEVTNIKKVRLSSKIIIATAVIIGVMFVSFVFYKSIANQTTQSVHTVPASVTPTAVSETTGEIDTIDEYVYITRYGDCYHRETCRYAKDGYKVALDSAVSTEYKPCSFCIPQ